jgi:hypothetical protein
LNLMQHEVGVRMASRMAYNASQARGTLNPGDRIVLTAVSEAVVPLSGVTYGDDHEVYGGQAISYIPVTADETITVPLR